MHGSNSIKFADDTTVVGLITNNNETAYREEVKALEMWCQENNLSLSVNKTKEMIVDFCCFLKSTISSFIVLTLRERLFFCHHSATALTSSL